MGSKLTAGRRALIAASACALLMAACSEGSETGTPETTLVRASTTSTLVPDTPTVGPGFPDFDPESSASTVVPIAVASLPVSVAFPAIDVIDPTLSFRKLSAGDLDRLEARFRQDERVEVFLADVDARGVYKEGEFVAVAISVAVAPSAASTAGFSESFIMGATKGGVVSPLPVVVLDQDLTSWLTANTGNLLWSHENLFVIVSGLNPLLVRDIASAIVTMVIDPPPPSEPVPVDVCAEVPPAEGDLADGDPADGEALDGEAVDPDVAGAVDAEPVDGEPVDGEPTAEDPCKKDPCETQDGAGDASTGNADTGDAGTGEVVEGDPVDGNGTGSEICVEPDAETTTTTTGT